MIIFWTMIALMLATTVAAVLWPLLGPYKPQQIDRDELNKNIIREQFKQLELDYKNARLTKEEYQAAREELERAVINDTSADANKKIYHDNKTKISAILLSLALPTAALFIYNLFGAPALIESPPRLPPTQAEVENMVDGLAARLQEEPENTQGWIVLGKSYMVMGRYTDAQAVYAKLLSDQPNDVNLLINYADASAMRNNGKFAGTPYATIKQVLQLEPDNIQARWMAGMAENEIGNNQVALSIWRPLLGELQQQSPEMAAELQRMIAAIEGSLNASADSTIAAADNSASDAASLTIKVSLPSDVDLDPSDTLFVYARAMQGPPLPLAIKRYTVGELPNEIVLDDTTAMMPAMRLSLFPMVKVDARISKSGSATPQSGDLFGRVENISIANSEIIEISIDQTVE